MAYDIRLSLTGPEALCPVPLRVFFSFSATQVSKSLRQRSSADKRWQGNFHGMTLLAGLPFFKFYLFSLWLCWVFVAARRLSLPVAGGVSSPVVGHRLLRLRSTGFQALRFQGLWSAGLMAP